MDYCSNFSRVFLPTHKSEVANIIKHFFFEMVKTHFGTKLKCFKYENAKENFLTNFLAEQDILHQFSCMGRHET